MAEHNGSIADIFRSHFDQDKKASGPLPLEHHKVAHAITTCRTELMGGHVWGCPQCDHEVTMYNSCRNRHCPRCQAFASAQWVQNRIDELLPVPYFHVVFTVPHQLNAFALRNKKVFYALFFRAVSQTLLELAQNPRRLGGLIGFIAILHTWGQNLMDHPHIHCVVPGGALSDDRRRWIGCSKDFLFPVPVIRALFKGKLLAGFQQALADGSMQLHGDLQQFTDKKLLGALLRQLYGMQWVVYVKPPFAGPEAVIKYLGNYTHRIAISDKRILAADENTVSFSYKDYADGARTKPMTLNALEFIRRFLLHVVPTGFMRIRHYGFLSNALQKNLLPLCMKLLGKVPLPKTVESKCWYDIIERLCGEDPRVCPHCRRARMLLRRQLPRLDRALPLIC